MNIEITKDIRKILLSLSILSLVLLTCFNKLQKISSLILLSSLIIVLGLVSVKKYGLKVNIISKNEIFFIVWIVYTLIQTAWIETNIKTWFYIEALIFGSIIVWIISRLIVNKKSVIFLYYAWGIGTFITIIYGLMEIFTNNHFVGSGAYFYGLKNVATVGFFNPNDYSFFLIISLPILLYLLNENKVFLLLCVITIISSIFIIYANGTRAIFLFYIGVLFMFILKLSKKRPILFGFLIIILLICISIFYDSILEIISDATASLSTSDQSTSVRIMLLQNGWEIFISNPLGIGSGNIEQFMIQNGYSVSKISVMHNFWLEILVQYGIFIFLLFIYIYLKMIYQIYIYYIKNKQEKAVLPILFSALIFIPACLASSTIFTFNITWFLIGIMIALTNLIDKESKSFSNIKLFG